jgi:hypothetical protein
VLYVLAAAVQICEIDISDDDDEKLQNAADKAETDLGFKDNDRDALWMQVVLDMQRDKAKACSELPQDVIRSIKALP